MDQGIGSKWIRELELCQNPRDLIQDSPSHSLNCQLDDSKLILQFALGLCYIRGNHCQSLGFRNFSLLPKASSNRFPTPSVHALFSIVVRASSLEALHSRAKPPPSPEVSKLEDRHHRHYHRRLRSSHIVIAHALPARSNTVRRGREALRNCACSSSSSSSPSSSSTGSSKSL